jgi:NADH-quinone oxidoreductase subunit J
MSILMITRKNPVHAVLWMLVLFVHIAALYLFLNAEFLAAIQMIIYAGAVLVLFLFVIMLLNLRKEEGERKYNTFWPVCAGISVIMVVFMLVILRKIEVIPPLGEYSIEKIHTEGSMMSVGKVLYTKYLLPFEIASFILLVAIIGAVILAKRRVE